LINSQRTWIVSLSPMLKCLPRSRPMRPRNSRWTDQIRGLYSYARAAMLGNVEPLDDIPGALDHISRCGTLDVEFLAR
jgi:hypothetical protein